MNGGAVARLVCRPACVLVARSIQYILAARFERRSIWLSTSAYQLVFLLGLTVKSTVHTAQRPTSSWLGKRRKKRTRRNAGNPHNQRFALKKKDIGKNRSTDDRLAGWPCSQPMGKLFSSAVSFIRLFHCNYGAHWQCCWTTLVAAEILFLD